MSSSHAASAQAALATVEEGDEERVLATLAQAPRPVSRVPVTVAGDILGMVLAVALVFDLRSPSSAGAIAALLFPLIGILMLATRQAYRWSPRDAAVDHALAIVSGLGVATLLGMCVADLGAAEPYTTPWIKVWVLSSLFVVGLRLVVSIRHRAQLVRGKGARPTLIVGAGTIGARLARRLDGAPDYGLQPIGFLDDGPLPEEAVGGRPAPVLGGIDDLDRVLAEWGVQQVIVAFSSLPDRRVVEVVRHCERLGLEVALVPRLFDLWNHRAAYDPIGGLPVLHMRGTDLRGWQFAVKSALDRSLAALALLVFAIPMAVIALAIRLSSPGPVLFRQARVGLDGREFDLLKFRSMRMPAQPPADVLAVADRGELGPGGVEGEDRRTPVGRLLRRSSLDELPQLINVARGEMSLVGPRPERPELADRFKERIERYDERLRVKSGITGWAQIHGLRGRTSLSDRIEMDNFYIEHFSLGLDLRIMMRTVVVFFRGAE